MINANKQYEIAVSHGHYGRTVIKTHFVKPGEDMLRLIRQYVVPAYTAGEMVAISSKIVSLCQNRIIYKKDMQLSLLAKFLSRFASCSDAGIGVNSVWKMQYAIDYCGRGKVIWAAMGAGFGKLFGKRGVFYDIVGMEIRGLDGFYDKSFEEYGDYGIQIPVDCDRLCNRIYQQTGVISFIADANDFTQDILGKSAVLDYTDKALCEIIADNPAGQSDQCTPFVLIRKLSYQE